MIHVANDLSIERLRLTEYISLETGSGQDEGGVGVGVVLGQIAEDHLQAGRLAAVHLDLAVLLLFVPFAPPTRQIPRFVRGALVPVLCLRAIVPPEALLQSGVRRGSALPCPDPLFPKISK